MGTGWLLVTNVRICMLPTTASESASSPDMDDSLAGLSGDFSRSRTFAKILVLFLICASFAFVVLPCVGRS